MAVQVKDIRQGKTFYSVMGFVEEDGGNSAIVEAVRAAGKPYWHNTVRSLFFQEYRGRSGKTDSASLQDRNVVPNNYNLHRMFKTRKAAERYAARIRSGCLTHAEQNKAQKIMRSRAEWYDPFHYDDYHDDYSI